MLLHIPDRPEQSLYGPEALAIGTTVKLARALWIVPVSLLTAAYMRSTASDTENAAHQAKVRIPWFIFLFVGASIMTTYLPRFMVTYMDLNRLGKAGLTATLFLIGTSLSKKTLQAVGIKPLLQGVLLWIIVGSASLVAIYYRPDLDLAVHETRESWEVIRPSASIRRTAAPAYVKQRNLDISGLNPFFRGCAIC